LRESDPREQELAVFQERIGVHFQSIALLDQALTHPSFVNECAGSTADDNQRLEFLGDAILDFLVGEWLFLRYPDAREGDLTSLRAYIVCTETLASFARQIDLGTCLRLGKGEDNTGGHSRPANLCAGLEALTGAMYLDQGMGAVRRWLNRALERRAGEIDLHRAMKDPKSLLQEYTQALLHVTPTYRIIREKGPDHAKVFTAQVLVDQDAWGEGSGATQRAEERAAAKAALSSHPTLLQDASH